MPKLAPPTLVVMTVTPVANSPRLRLNPSRPAKGSPCSTESLMLPPRSRSCLLPSGVTRYRHSRRIRHHRRPLHVKSRHSMHSVAHCEEKPAPTKAPTALSRSIPKYCRQYPRQSTATIVHQNRKHVFVSLQARESNFEGRSSSIGDGPFPTCGAVRRCMQPALLGLTAAQ